ncbi:uncharacterized protein KIAA2012-like isoform X1 [Hypanus sabinus]|uniref:uncharacterized protein KIAA2012-like isoform X1 n=1 Tax=Hypanus sabinus TaxID=79690 RepID=UPI0028C395D9|nr:uncharacterized protein KIAA2012-like isoform X1 [Hypanus sabinus]
MWNLSLLSRGYGELVNREHKRLDVYFETQDYFNWRSWRNTDCISLKSYHSNDFVQDHHNPAVPRTFSTRRGALVLYSEDLALRAWQQQRGAKWRQMARLQLCTLSDLASAVLAYGRREKGSHPNQMEPYLYFLFGHKNRKIRPGYSAKRYLTCLTESCDPSLLHRMQGSGCIRDLSLFRGISINSLLLHQTKCDLSEVPRPYQFLPCLPFSPHYQNCLPLVEEEEEEEENVEEQSLHAGEPCPISHVKEGGLEPDSCRSGESTRQLQMDNEVECTALQESNIYLLIALPPNNQELDKGEPEQPPCSPLIKDQEVEGKDHGQRCGILGRPVIDSSQLFSQKSNVTYYGGTMAGSRRGLCVKSRPSDHCGSGQPVESGGFKTGRLQLPPISLDTEAGVCLVEEGNNGEPEPLRLPVKRRRPVAAAWRARQRRARTKPEAAQHEQQLLLPPLMDDASQNQHAGDVSDEVTENEENPQCSISEELPKVERVNEEDQLYAKCPIGTEMRSGLDGQETGFLPQISSPSKTEERTVEILKKKTKENDVLLEENVVRSLKEGPVLQMLPPIQGTAGPGKQSSMACFRSKARRTKTSAAGIVRGTVPGKLREVHKDISMGSLIMAPDGDIVRLSMLDSVRGPAGSFLSSSSHAKGSKAPLRGFGGKKNRSIPNQRMEGGLETDSATRSSCQEEDVWSSSDDDILWEMDGDSSRSQTPTQLTSKQRRAQKALRRRHKRQTQPDGKSSGKGHASMQTQPDGKSSGKGHASMQTQPDGTSSGELVSKSARGAKVNNERRAKGEGKASRRRRRDLGDTEEMALGENGNPRPAGHTRHNTDHNWMYEREHTQGTRKTTRGSTHNKTAAGSSMAAWSQSEHGSRGTDEELGSPISSGEGKGGYLPRASRRRKLREDGFVAEEDSEGDVGDWEAEPWSEVSERRTEINAKKQKAKKKGRRSSNQDPDIEEADWAPSSEGGQRGSAGSILVPAGDSPSEQGRSRRRPAANNPSEPRGSLNPNGPLGGKKGENKINRRPEFVVGRPRENRAQQHYLPPGKQQRKEMRGGEVEEDIVTQIGSEACGLHSPSGRSMPTTGSAGAVEAGMNSSSTDVRVMGSGEDGVWIRGQTDERSGWPEDARSVPGSKPLRQAGSNNLEADQWLDGESQNPGERRHWTLEQQIQQELDEEQRRREERRFKRQQQEHPTAEQEGAEQQQEDGGQQRQREEYRRKVQEMQQAKERILQERAKEKARLHRLHQEQLEEEQRLLSEMDEPQRQEYLRLKQIREEDVRQQWEKRRQQEGERNRWLLEEARREAEAFLRQKGLIGQGLMLRGGLLLELLELEQGQNITRPWVFSYFELMEILGLETPVKSEQAEIGSE